MGSVVRARTALVTGASAGIGRTYCRQLAALGFNIVAVARRSLRLRELADGLTLSYGVTVTPITADLARPQAAAEVLDVLVKADIEVDMLVNNAGYGVPGKFLSSVWQVHADYGQLMMMTAAELCHLLLPGMRTRGHGCVINVASIAGFLPGTAGHTLYGASKAWLIAFSESLALEYAADGIRVCAVCPGFTYSEFHDVTGTRAQVEKLPAWLWMEAETVVAHSLAALSSGDSVFIPGRINRVIVRVARWLPRRLLLQLTRRESRRFRDVS